MSILRGRFRAPASEEMQRFSSSLSVDLEMVEEDVEASLAHAAELAEVGVLSLEEAEALERGLLEVLEEIRSGAFRPGDEHEDIHMAVEARLTDIVGDSGRRLHTARSRNDQVATDVRLWARKRIDEIDEALRELIHTLLERVEVDGRVLLPGYTHLQRGQPILLGHHLLAHAWALSRDRERFEGARTRVDRSPLGAAALAGTSYPIRRERVALDLGFSGLMENAMDAVSARDHLQETAAACAICMTNLSRMAEELYLWSTSEFGFVRLPDAFTTGSSIMPQKRNPDAAELVRGKTGRVYGALQTLLVIAKGLPLAYNRDLQEDRQPLFDALKTTRDCLEITSGMWRDLEVRNERFEEELRGDFSLATDLADFLVGEGVPFREAHEIVGRLVAHCEETGTNLGALEVEQAAAFHPALGVDLSDLLDPRSAVERRTSRGGTAWVEIERQVALLAESLER